MDARKIHDIALQLSKLVDSLLQEFDAELEPKTQQEIADLVEQGVCLICKRAFKPKQKRVRGTHENCKVQMFKRYKEKDLIAAGWILPPDPGGRPSSLKDKILPSDSIDPKPVSQGKPKRKNKD